MAHSHAFYWTSASHFPPAEELSVGQAVEVQLDVQTGTGTRELKNMDDLPKRQHATVLLLLLLGASNASVVIEQPEDDLDNRFVYDGIVSNLRSLKGKCPMIANTHNANIPVLGDAELIGALEGDGQNGRAATDEIRSLDDVAIRSHVDKVLEGTAAFIARQHLYGLGRCFVQRSGRGRRFSPWRDEGVPDRAVTYM